LARQHSGWALLQVVLLLIAVLRLLLLLLWPRLPCRL
jgi:hypothetical protein